ncbi:hypothetical protein B296_00045462, partial [Ensete ventricosum]
MFISRFAISTCTARYRQYIPVRQVVGTQTARYRAVPPKIDRRWSISIVDSRFEGKIDCRQSIEGEINHRRSIEREKGKKKKRKRRKKGEDKKKEYLAPTRRPRPRAVAAHESPTLARCRRL